MAKRAGAYFQRYLRSANLSLETCLPASLRVSELKVSFLAALEDAGLERLEPKFSRWLKKAERAERKDLQRKELAKTRYLRKEEPQWSFP